MHFPIAFYFLVGTLQNNAAKQKKRDLQINKYTIAKSKSFT